uniref:CRIB domain-containing protein n=1 Tax=Schistosoma japonicum TaxID=6182 RepID=B3GV01_SCHJA
MLCCIPNAATAKRVKIDRFSIGNPINFRHITHMGSTRFCDDNVSNAFDLIDHQSLPVHLKLVDIPNLSSNNCASLTPGTLVPKDLCIGPTVSHTFATQSASVSKSTRRNSLLDPNSTLSESFKTPHVVTRHSTHLGNLKPESLCLDLSLPLPPPPSPPPPINPISLRSMLLSSLINEVSPIN